MSDNKVIETRPFRSPLFQGFRIRVRITGEIVNNTTGKVIALISANPHDRRVISFEQHDPKAKQDRTEHLTKFYHSDFTPILAKLRGQRDASKRALREAKRLTTEANEQAARIEFLTRLIASEPATVTA